MRECLLLGQTSGGDNCLCMKTITLLVVTAVMSVLGSELAGGEPAAKPLLLAELVKTYPIEGQAVGSQAMVKFDGASYVASLMAYFTKDSTMVIFLYRDDKKKEGDGAEKTKTVYGRIWTTKTVNAGTDELWKTLQSIRGEMVPSFFGVTREEIGKRLSGGPAPAPAKKEKP